MENNLRNAFEALCDYASIYSWSWDFSHRLLGQRNLRVGFAKIIRGEHPDDDNFWPKSEKVINIDLDSNLCKTYGEFVILPYSNTRIKQSNQIKLAKIVASANLENIRKTYLTVKRRSSEPIRIYSNDWLGYIGVVIDICWESQEAMQIISEGLIPQFIHMTDEEETKAFLAKKLESKEHLTIGDLGVLERTIEIPKYYE